MTRGRWALSSARRHNSMREQRVLRRVAMAVLGFPKSTVSSYLLALPGHP